MKNFEEIMSERKNRIEARKDELIRRSLLSEEFLEMIQKNKRPFDLLMSYYQCAVMEIETKFRVLPENSADSKKVIKETHGKTEKETEKTRQSALDSGIFSGTCCFLLFRVQADRHLPGLQDRHG